MNIFMAINTLVLNLAENKICMTVSAFHSFMTAFKIKTRLAVIKFVCLNRTPVRAYVAGFTGEIYCTMWIFLR